MRSPLVGRQMGERQSRRSGISTYDGLPRLANRRGGPKAPNFSTICSDLTLCLNGVRTTDQHEAAKPDAYGEAAWCGYEPSHQAKVMWFLSEQSWCTPSSYLPTSTNPSGWSS